MPPSEGGHHGLRYRPDIDGLRALAVILVLLFHLGTRVTGGFVGVDVFFVISGNLITGVILSDIAANRFSLARFYERRIRRILPALFVVMAVSTILAWRYFIPSELIAYGRSQLAAIASVSNLLFRNQAGYFDSPNVFKPLLHTWSLGVEEQFYFAFPLLLLAITKWLPHRMRSVLCGLALVSFAASVIAVSHDRNTAFFLAPLRAWELLVGAILSRKYLPPLSTRVTRNLAALAGLALILFSALRYTGGTPFPGIAALAPCIGAGLIIAAGETGPSLIGAALSWRPIVFLGLISYSLYLWHWPLLAFQRSDAIFFAHPTLTPAAKLLFCVFAIVIATLSWAFVEQPFRRGRFRPSSSTLLKTAATSAAALAAVSIALIASHGFPHRFPPAAQQIGAYASYDRAVSTRDGICYLQPEASFASFRPDICLARRPGRPSILLAGDSHAAALYPGLAAVFPEDDILQANVSSCRPAPAEPPGTLPTCAQLNAFLFGDYLPTHPVDTLLLAARWSASDFGAIADTVAFARARNIRVILIGPAVEYDQPLPRLLAIAIRRGDPNRAALHRDPIPQRLDADMARLAATLWHVPYISIYRDLCTPACPLYAAPGVPLLFDSHHVTADGARLIARAIRARGELAPPAATARPAQSGSYKTSHSASASASAS